MIGPVARRLAAALLILLAPTLAPGGRAAAETGVFEPLTIVSKAGPRPFQVEVMRNDEERSRGLMFRRAMAADRGMLFDFERLQVVTMWMRNTYLPLDMIFIRPDGTIARIAADTEPLSERIIPSGEPVVAVLELNAGAAAKLGIRAGDRVEHPLFKGR